MSAALIVELGQRGVLPYESVLEEADFVRGLGGLHRGQLVFIDELIRVSTGSSVSPER
ncbi:hypothetical protein [Streptacidiphilus sp. EB103A]|uniref:hypothetical protein n=1 Tax=Streptacidiphilus sp. EB103A TaxID=3156275 RepID=UPI003511BAD8